jgi:hypothetical protein
MYSKIWRQLLVIWIAIGIGVSGYYYIFPKTHKKIEHYGKGFEWVERKVGPKVITIVEPMDKVSLLITIVGIILIAGFGIQSKNRHNN